MSVVPPGLMAPAEAADRGPGQGTFIQLGWYICNLYLAVVTHALRKILSEYCSRFYIGLLSKTACQVELLLILVASLLTGRHATAVCHQSFDSF